MPNSQNNQPTASEIQTIFDRIAPVYDRLNNWLSLGQHRIWKLMAVKWSDPTPGDVGLDVCCGSGDLAQLLARQIGTTGKVIGVDFAKEQLAIAHQKNSSLFAPLPIEWVEGDALNLPFDSDTFDCATMGYGLRNVIDIPRCLQELHRVLKKDAKAAILDFHRPDNPLMQTFQEWYLQTIVVPTAQSFGLTEEYAYISPSLERFPTGVEQVNLAQDAGFVNAVHYPIANGIMGVLVVKK
ncbi:bifunctional demethylmenaquinone methyltransferase/2-methoxy-6-polyprenyl-1,4-benzoquinol methylase UbiE [Candidatus Gracilibacteria bacterium]|nr:bifunctional demethylmenaquinone methyltransferase/2-methoxy-6-polyprenyl-1,4-benzoquinol methylase UbiE [Candidatus Gracilibacteria bacterium]NJM86482.1 bifunctional demethylmenaquinone methyltransferase/2-methoxy-6-polyprenyl-1,4-benzoquinol methylase UbiE [Hydrococcus sp. RU_2_2]NJP17961.1 bifunctional demethylmenaquinone methyltransferase/2-methoxy-6-polyprenyl-1,4-benzoquinol methylase UbiE [Hydrococcus sp. CRU_1_1]